MKPTLEEMSKLSQEFAKNYQFDINTYMQDPVVLKLYTDNNWTLQEYQDAIRYAENIRVTSLLAIHNISVDVYNEFRLIMNFPDKEDVDWIIQKLKDNLVTLGIKPESVRDVVLTIFDIMDDTPDDLDNRPKFNIL